jgi:hypothetical protein
VPILVQALLEDSPTEIVCLAPPHFLDSVAKFVVFYPSLARRLSEPGGFEGPRGLLSIH